MECVRFGGSIPPEYWGCCAGDIFQNFHQDPDTPASIQLVEGDSGYALTVGREYAFLGPTLRDIFWARLKYSTFGTDAMPNHFFLAVLEDSQLSNDPGRKWLAILKEAGFEFIRTTDNSVYTGDYVGESYEPEPCSCGDPDCSMGENEPHKNHIFGLFRNIGGCGRIDDPFTPPRQWTELPTAVPEMWTLAAAGLDAAADYEMDNENNCFKAFANEQRDAHLRIWNEKIEPQSIKTEKEITEAGAPVIMAGIRTEFPPELKADREKKLADRKAKGCPNTPSQGTQYLYKAMKQPSPLLGLDIVPTPPKG